MIARPHPSQTFPLTGLESLHWTMMIRWRCNEVGVHLHVKPGPAAMKDGECMLCGLIIIHIHTNELHNMPTNHHDRTFILVIRLANIMFEANASDIDQRFFEVDVACASSKWPIPPGYAESRQPFRKSSVLTCESTKTLALPSASATASGVEPRACSTPW